MTRLIVAGALTLLLTAGAAAAPGTAVTTVNLRAEANTTSAILGKIGQAIQAFPPSLFRVGGLGSENL